MKITKIIQGLLFLAVSGHSLAYQLVSETSKKDLKTLEMKIAQAMDQIAVNEVLSGNNLKDIKLSVSDDPETLNYLGLTLQSDFESGHLVVAKIDKNSFADKLMLQPGDQLLAVNQQMLTQNNLAHLSSLLSEVDHNEKLMLTVQRDGKLAFPVARFPKVTAPGFHLAINDGVKKAPVKSVKQESVPEETFLDDEISQTKRFIPLHNLPPCLSKGCKRIYKKYLKQARYANNILAKIRRAEFKYAGFGVEQDMDAALDHFTYLSGREVAHADYMIGVIKLELEKSLAIEYFEKAAAAGHHLANLELAKLYLSQQVEPNKVDPYLVKALEGQSLEAIEYVKQLLTSDVTVLNDMPALQNYLDEEQLLSENELSRLEQKVYANNSNHPKLEALANLGDRVSTKTERLIMGQYLYAPYSPAPMQSINAKQGKP